MVGYLWKRNNIYWISILYLALGLVLTVFPDMSSTVFCWGLAATTAVYSLLHFWRFYTAYKQNKKDYTALGMGILFGAACVFCIGWQSVLLSFLPIALGAILLIDGIGKIPVLLEIQKEDGHLFRILLLAAILPVIMSIIMFSNPFRVVRLVITAFGVGLTIDGICDLSVLMYCYGKVNGLKVQMENDTKKEIDSF